VTLWELASRLGLTINSQDSVSATLRNANDTVLLFTHTGSQFFVNGRAAGPVGLTERRSGVLYLDSALVRRIGEQLGRYPVPRPVPAPSPRITAFDKGTIMIDAGHGGKDPGTSSLLGYPEKSVTLSVAQEVAVRLRDLGYHVITTRDRDVWVSVPERWQRANRYRPRLFVSIHADANPNVSAEGFTLYIARGASAGSRRAAACLEDALDGLGRKNRGIRPAGFQVLIHTTCPAVLIEMGFLTHSREARELRDPRVQSQLAQAIVAGIVCYQ
jgi:N-acetylmuramoyl-L-alanine amidase